MSLNEAKYPNWDGLSPTRGSRLDNQPPTSEDWDQLVAEMLANQAATVAADAAAAAAVQSADTVELSIVDRGDVGPLVNALYPWETPTRLSNPGTLPADSAEDAAFSPNGEFLAIAHGTSPYVTIYRRDGNQYTKIANPGVLPGVITHGVAWSPNGEFLAVGHVDSSGDRIIIYQRSGSTFTAVADPGTQPAGTTFHLAWSPNSEYLACPHQSTPFITIYQRDGTTFTKLADPGTLPSSTARFARWSPDGQYLAVGSFGSPAITVYRKAGTTFTKLADPPTPPTAGATFSLAWSPFDNYLAVDDNTTLRLYQVSGNTISDVATAILSKTARDMEWHPNGRLLAVGYLDNSPYFDFYSWDGTTLALATNLPVAPVSSIMGVSWSADGRFLALAEDNSPFVGIYETTGNITKPVKVVF